MGRRQEVNLCAQGTSVAPAVKFCFDSGQIMLLGIAVLILCLFCMAVGAGMRKK
jgi:hypothetical protein